MGTELRFGDVCKVDYLDTVRIMAISPAPIAWGKFTRTGTWWGIVLIDDEDSKPGWDMGELVTLHSSMAGFQIIERRGDQ